MNAISPFGGNPVPFQSHLMTGTFCRYELSTPYNGHLYVGEDMAMKNSPYSNSTRGYTLRETEAAWGLVRSKMWRAHCEQSLPICVFTEYEYSIIRQNPDKYPKIQH